MIPTKQVRIPTGGDAQQLWQMFEVIVDVIGTSNCPVLLDITHGFRMQHQIKPCDTSLVTQRRNCFYDLQGGVRGT